MLIQPKANTAGFCIKDWVVIQNRHHHVRTYVRTYLLSPCNIRLYAHTLIRLFDWPIIRLLNVRTQTSVQKGIQKSFFWVFTPTPRVLEGWKSQQWGWFFASNFIELSRDSETLQNRVLALFLVFLKENRSKNVCRSRRPTYDFFLQKCVPQPPTDLRFPSKNVCRSRRPTYDLSKN